jgi:hypothetical protein
VRSRRTLERKSWSPIREREEGYRMNEIGYEGRGEDGSLMEDLESDK